MLGAIYELGIMQGDENNRFRPDDGITRQETAVVICNFYAALNGESLRADADALNLFNDKNDVAPWAQNAVSSVASRGFMGDYGDGAFHPHDSVTTEQAVSMVSRMIDAPKASRPVITSHSDKSTAANGTQLEWDGDDSFGEYTVNIFDGGEIMRQAVSYSHSFELSGLMENRSYYTWIEQGENPVYSEPIQIFTGSPKLNVRASYSDGKVTVEWDASGGSYTVTTVQSRSHRSSERIESHTDSYETSETSVVLPSAPSRIYDITVSNGIIDESVHLETDNAVIPSDDAFTAPQSSEDAEAMMTEIEVDVWKMDGSGAKRASKATLTVHRDIADEVRAVFREIFEGEEQFPIESVGGYSWRGGRSEHNWGTAIDINPTQNYCIYTSGEVIGDFWRPYESPYSITPYGDVMNAFENHGFTWGGDAWSGNIDYMHFSYFGT